MSDEGYIKNVGYIGSISLLVASITGPGIVLIPYMYQQAGWLLPSIAFIGIMILTGLAAMFIIEASSKFPGNEKFGRSVEFTVLVHQFFGRNWYYITIFILYGSLQSVSIASIVGSAQIFDNLFVTLFGGTCGVGISPKSGFYCVNSSGTGNSPFGSNYMLATFGLVVDMMIVIPLTKVDINANMLPQLLSMIYVFLFTITVIYQSSVTGLQFSALPALNKDRSSIIGMALFNFALANEVPSWINIKHPSVDIKRSVWIALAIVCVCYIFIGIFGSLAFKTNASINILQAMYINPTLGTFNKVWIGVIYFLYPFLTYMTSLPIAMIVVKMNFVSAKLCSKDVATLWAVYAPFLIAIPLQTGSISTHFGIWTSLTFQAACNFLGPFLIFFFLNKRNMIMAQSVIDELEFLDITSGLRKVIREDEDDFDYIYHLPYANPSMIIPRDPFKKAHDSNKDIAENEFTGKLGKAQSISQLSVVSRHSIRDIRRTLNPSEGDLGAAYIRSVNRSRQSLYSSNNQLARRPSVQGSIANLGTNFASNMASNAQLASYNGSQMPGTKNRAASIYARSTGPADPHRAILGLYSGGGAGRGYNQSDRHSTYQSTGSGKVAPISDLDDDVSFNNGGIYQITPPFKAVPRWVTEIVRPQWLCGIGLIIMSALVLNAIITTVIS